MLADEGIEYRPLVWSCWGRPHCDANAALASMAAAASRRRGVATPEVLARRAKTLVGIQLWRRAAAMVASCVPAVAACDAADLIPEARDRRREELGLSEPDGDWSDPVAADAAAAAG
jgi:hypothetical protein